MLPHRTAFLAMASENEVQLDALREDGANTIAQAVVAEVERIEAKYSRYLPDSVVSRINAAAGIAPITVDTETEQLLSYADVCFVQSGGLFDITSGVLRKAWDFSVATPPENSAIERLLPLIGWDRVEREPGQIYLPIAGMEIDFGGFGKEYAVDRALRVLAGGGVKHGFVNLGGDLAAVGPRADGTPWGVGIRHPRKADTLIATLPLYSGAIATSGDYERYFEFEGQRFSHILDPRTGQPVRGLQSVTVHAPSCLVAGSATTIAMLKGDVAGLAWLEALEVPYLCVRADGAQASTFD